ncbi:hypothetical protein [Ligilactobacillus ceti]|uniref:Uncharacterized protein n=1 Tax=Ligilactobacillus ceti DSM 22408 TaxID=1122146 RepID=A0A0R2KMZ4_9LACO|nr:hypothetical protein [Ligilactobacillus ceti]KRN88837.1 hypothetical protein IV53_GL000807 [Ligilactobacillus ceti DSM 22408]
MLEQIRLKRTLSEAVQVGEVIQYKKRTYVIINIMSIHIYHPLEQDKFQVIDCLAQEMGTPDLSKNYTVTQAEIPYNSHDYFKIAKVGEVVFDKNAEIWVRVTNILNTRIEDGLFYVNYEFTPVSEWPKRKIQRAYEERCKTKMKLIRNNKSQ